MGKRMPSSPFQVNAPTSQPNVPLVALTNHTTDVQGQDGRRRTGSRGKNDP